MHQVRCAGSCADLARDLAQCCARPCALLHEVLLLGGRTSFANRILKKTLRCERFSKVSFCGGGSTIFELQLLSHVLACFFFAESSSERVSHVSAGHHKQKRSPEKSRPLDSRPPTSSHTDECDTTGKIGGTRSTDPQTVGPQFF